MNCKDLRKRSKKGQTYIYCNKKKEEIRFVDCNTCHHKEYKPQKGLNKKSNKLTYHESTRYSLIYTDFKTCCECGIKDKEYDPRIDAYTKVEKNEIFGGAYRKSSIADGMIAPMCIYCHRLFHQDIDLKLKYKAMFQEAYLKDHSLNIFIKHYGQNYIYKLKSQNKRS